LADMWQAYWAAGSELRSVGVNMGVNNGVDVQAISNLAIGFVGTISLIMS